MVSAYSVCFFGPSVDSSSGSDIAIAALTCHKAFC